MEHSANGDFDPWVRRAAIGLCLVLGISAVYFFLRFAGSAFMPFLIAALLALTVRPAAGVVERKWHLPRRFSSIVLLLLLLSLLTAGIYLGVRRGVAELNELTEDAAVNAELWSDRLTATRSYLSSLTAHIPLLGRLFESEALQSMRAEMDAKLASLITDALGAWSTRIPDFIGSFLRGIPSALLFFFTTLFAAFYFCADGDRIFSWFLGLFPTSLRNRLPHLRRQTLTVARHYVTAYLLLFLLTFLLLWIGFSLIGLSYTLLPALLIALIDILPVLGVGTVLVPWAAVSFLAGNGSIGTGLLVLWGVILLCRQFAEPHILGEKLGLHPLATLFAAYVGFQFFGLGGMLLGPAAALGIKVLLPQNDSAGAVETDGVSS